MDYRKVRDTAREYREEDNRSSFTSAILDLGKLDIHYLIREIVTLMLGTMRYGVVYS
jgi:hypothetical protein